MSNAMLLFSLAWRNLWRNRRRTLLILFAIVLGGWAMIVMAAFMRGMVMQVFDDTIENLTGHIQIHHPGYLDDPVIDYNFSIGPDLEKVLSDSAIAHWASRIRIPAVVASERESVGVMLLGIDPDREAKLSFLEESVVEGKYFSSDEEKGIIIGKKLADRLETQLGRRVVLMSQDRTNQLRDGGFRIVGIFDAPLEMTELSWVFLTRKQAAEFVALGDQLSEISIRLKEPENSEALSIKMSDSLKNLDVKSWHKVDPFLKVMVEVYDSSAIIWHLIVFLAMAFGIVNTMLMAVFERTREFGLFIALGLKPRFILGQVWLEGILLILVGLAVANLVSWLTVLATGDGIDVSAFARGMEMIQMSNIIPFVITQKDLVIANVTVIVLGVLTGLYPAWKASRLVPADALTRV
ncbi:MAG: ABC transporter permease [Gammaproteobacteria bacterium]|nr:ABC transporter permease [Gammaproteobacteria bacterium]MDH5691994.1 ABC transporter permease [Gammaproteobacteria bacterium]